MHSIVRRKKNRFIDFRAELKLSGYESYDHYLASDQWKAFREFYKSVWLPHKCLACGSREFELHHWTYARITRENPTDVIPLCREHHLQVHKWMLGKGIDESTPLDILMQCFGVNTDDAFNAVRPFTKMQKMQDDAERRNAIQDNNRRRLTGLHPKPIKAVQPTTVSQPGIKCSRCHKYRKPSAMLANGECIYCLQERVNHGGKPKRPSKRNRPLRYEPLRGYVVP